MTTSSLLAHRDYLRYQTSRFLSTVGTQMASVCVGWQVYDLTHRKLDLGFVGLAQFFPALILPLVTGVVADRFDRRRIVALCHVASALCFAALFFIAWSRVKSPAPIYAVLVLLGVARAFMAPAAQALLPNLVEPELFSAAVSWSSTVWQVAAVSGPALGGLLYAFITGKVFAISTCTSLVAAALVSSLDPISQSLNTAPPRWSDVVAGLRYVFDNTLVLATISLDLFAVLFGGAVALLPVFASDVLHIGPWGLGLLRSAPAFGAAGMAIVLAYRPIGRHAGLKMLAAVAVFGAAMTAFSLSRSFALSLFTLVVSGAADMVSVVVRQHAVQLATPDVMRGRVSAVNSVFVSTSNELGEFESGLTAEWLGPRVAGALGGAITVAVVAIWAVKFRPLRELDRLDSLAENHH